MALLTSLSELLNRSPASVLMEQMRKLYMRLYPYIAVEFVHVEDNLVTMAQLSAQIAELQLALASHTHIAPDTPPSPGLGIPGNAIPVVPTNALGLANILPAGFPQPTGEGIAILPSRIGTPIEIVAIPPLTPTDFAG